MIVKTDSQLKATVKSSLLVDKALDCVVHQEALVLFWKDA